MDGNKPVDKESGIIVKAVTLALPVTEGELEMTRIAYPVPKEVFVGMVTIKVPEPVPESDPNRVIGLLAKEPEASDN